MRCHDANPYAPRPNVLHGVLAALLLFIVLLLTGTVSAQSKAVELAREGKSHYDRGEWAEALERFEAAELDAHSPVIVLYAARCLRNLGRLTEAKARFAKTARETLSDDAPAPFVNAKKEASEDLASISARIPKLTITTTGAARDWTVAVDGEPVQSDTLALDPGRHVINATDDDGAKRFRRTLELAEGSSMTVDIDPSMTPEPDPPRSGHPTTDVGPSAGIISGTTLVSIGGAALIAGTVLRIVAVQTFDDVKDNCVEGVCRAEDESDLDRSVLFQNVSTGLFIGGGVLAATGIVLFFALGDGEPSSTALRVSPNGLSLVGRF